MKKNIGIWLKTGITLFLLVIVFIYLQSDQQRYISEKEEQLRQAKLNIALVNEDKGVVFNGTTYNLARNYIKKIEKDQTNIWHVVSRGTGEKGLREGEYQLLLSIPSYFSEKILAIKEVNPEGLNLDYKVNGNGNRKLESDAQRMGKQIISDLNEQLVDMYIVSILDNLYTAQQNISQISKKREENLEEYQDAIYQTSVAFPEKLTSLSHFAESSISAEENLVNSLSLFSEQNKTHEQSGSEHLISLAELLEERKNGTLEYENFTMKLMEMDADFLSQETNAMYHQLSDTNFTLQEEFGAQGSDGSFMNKISDLKILLENNEENIKEMLEPLEKNIETLTDGIKLSFYHYFFDENLTLEDIETKPILLKDILAKDYGEDISEAEKIKIWLEILVAEKKAKEEDLKESINQLPFRKKSDLIAALTYDGQIDLINKIMLLLDGEQGINKLIEKHHFSQKEPAPLQKKLVKLINELKAMEAAAITTKKEIKLTDLEGLTIGTIKVDAPDFIIINQITADGVDITGDPSYNSPRDICVSYSFTESMYQKKMPKIRIQFHQPGENGRGGGVTGDNQGHIIEENTNDSREVQNSSSGKFGLVWEANVDVSEFYSENFNNLRAQYHQLLEEIYHSYQVVLQKILMWDSENEEAFEGITDLLELDMSSYFFGVIDEIAGIDLKQQKVVLQKLYDLKNQASEFNHDMEKLIAKSEEIQKNTMQLEGDVKLQLEKLELWREQMQGIKENETKVKLQQQQTDQNFETSKMTADNLYQESKLLKDESQRNIEETEKIKNIFVDFDEHMQSAQTEAKLLSKDADDVMTKFKEEVKDNEAFVSAFLEVLNNAYKNGVVNENLMKFLGKPIQDQSITTEIKENNKPFSWLLILYALALFLASIFATQNMKRPKNKSVHLDERRIALQNNIFSVSVLFLLGLMIGGVVAYFSIRALFLAKTEQVSWIFILILYTLIFLFGNYIMLKHLKIFGIGCSMFFLISYLLLSNYTATNIGMSYVAKKIKWFNPLLLSEMSLSKILMKENINRIVLYGSAAALLILIFLGIFLRPKLKESEQE